MEWYGYLLACAAAVAGGLVNALAGGGTLITFPVLTALGIPAMAANITNTVALCPGYLGGTVAQSDDLRGQGRKLWILWPAGIAGGVAGGFLLLLSGEKLFRGLVPWLILLASILIALQPLVRSWLLRPERQGTSRQAHAWALLLVFPGAVYGGYFGAGLGVILLATLGLIMEESLTRVNAVKQSISLVVNVAAAVFFVFSGMVLWTVALVMMAGALAGGYMGGRLAGKINPELLRWIVVSLGVVVAILYFF